MRSKALTLTLLAFVVAAVFYMTLGVKGNWGFVLGFRGAKLLALVTVATAVALSTMVFQTISGNRILTPSVMGFDSLYLLIQTGLIFAFSGLGVAMMGVYTKFALETTLMLVASLALFGTLLSRKPDIDRMILTGIIFGVLFRSLTSLLNRMIDPNEFSVVQSASFARFNTVDANLTWIAAAITLVLGALLMARHRQLDVMALGRDAAVNLGLDFDRESRRLLVLIAVLVSVSTALVGPVVFFGLLVSALAHQFTATWHHSELLPLSAALAATILVGSQTLFERVLGLQTSVSVVIEALGGLVFLALIFARRRA